MYRRVIANLKFETPSEQNTFKNDLSTKLDGITCFDKDVNHREDIEGTPQSTVDCRSEGTADADDLYTFIKDEMDTIPALSGRVHWHNCRHDEGPPFEPCVIQEEYSV